MTKTIFQFLVLLTLLTLPVSAYSQEAYSQEKEEEGAPAAQNLSAGMVIDRIVATVDGEPLTLSDVRRHLIAVGRGETLDAAASKEEVRPSLNELIGITLLLREAEAEGIAVADDEISAYIGEIKRQNQVDAAGFEELLSAQGLNEKQYRQQVRSDILRARVMSARVRSKINVIDEDIQRYLEERPDLIPTVGSQRVEQVAMPSALMAEAPAREALEKVRERVIAGASMKEAAQTRYVDLGYLNPAELREELKSVVEGATVGELSEPIVLSSGVYLFRVSAVYAETSDIDSILKEEIRRELYERRFKEAVTEYVNVELPKKYHVEIKL